MNTVSEVQNFIMDECGLKTSVKKGTGSMKGYIIITPMFQAGIYPSIPFEIAQRLKAILSRFDTNEHPLFCSTSNICVFGIEDDRVNMKRESKPKVGDNQKGWGSKNSQIRLDKAVKRYAKRLRKGNCARYY